MDNYDRALAGEIRATRVGLGVSQADLADASGVPMRTLGRIENGVVQPKSNQLAALVWSLHMDLGEFYRRVEDRCYMMVEARAFGAPVTP